MVYTKLFIYIYIYIILEPSNIYDAIWLRSSGDLGQTHDSYQTLQHYVSNPKGQAVLYVGDLSYADDHPYHDNVRWDTFGRFIEKSAAYQSWVWTAGNHEIDFAPEIVINKKSPTFVLPFGVNN
jgi:hypothetical protein